MSESMTAMDRLRKETRECHLETERSPLACAMAKGTLSIEEYVAQLQAYREVHAALESALAKSRDARVRAVVTEDMLGKERRIEADLAALERVPRALSPIPTGALRSYIETIGADARDGAALLGHLYVFEGSTLGASLLVKRMIAGLGLTADECRYYRGYGADTFPHWEAFKSRMNAALDDDALQTRAGHAARSAFEAIGAIFGQIVEAAALRSPTRASCLVSVEA